MPIPALAHDGCLANRAEALAGVKKEASARGAPELGTVEINMDKIESVDVDQSITGRRSTTGT
jgi:hypothetical protein